MRVFAYFKNIPLLSCFLGIGIGLIQTRLARKNFTLSFMLFILTVLLLGPRAIFLNPAGASDYIWGIGATSSTITHILAVGVFMVVVFGLFIWNTYNFSILGAKIGTHFIGDSLRAYSINIAGSLAGILLFTLMAFFSTPPIAWVTVLMVMYAGYSFFYTLHEPEAPKRLAVSSVLFIIFSLVTVFTSTSLVFWSPYYKVEMVESRVDGVLAGYGVKVNGDGHMTAMNYSKEFLDKYGKRGSNPDILELPYRLKDSKYTLVVGAGMGNDVAAGLRVSRGWIDAVEIDPKIISLGKKYHPEHPYDNPRVSVINDDARHFFKTTDAKYDLIIFGILDSHTQLSSISKLRLDNFMYTIEAMRDAKSLLNPGGFIVLTFSGDAKNLWMGKRFHMMLKEVFDREPLVFDVRRLMLIGGLGEEVLDNPYMAPYLDKRIRYEGEMPPQATDDWPFIYMKERGVPYVYLLMILAVLAISFLMMKWQEIEVRKISPQFFLLGAAFMLIETKAVTQLALTFGTTWLVNAIVISVIMVLILLANMTHRSIRLPDWLLLILSLALPLNGVFVLVPIIFSSRIFARLFFYSSIPRLNLASNLLGVMFGGCLEYISLQTGIASLSYIAIGIYVLAYLVSDFENHLNAVYSYLTSIWHKYNPTTNYRGQG